MNKNLLLISNSTLHGSGYLDHCEPEIKSFLGNRDVKRVTFVPYARPSGKTHDEYTEIARERFEKMGLELVSVHESNSPPTVIEEAEAIFIGGGNTFKLLRGLHDSNLTGYINARVTAGDALYMGTSAGANVACATAQTTNDMPTPKELPPSMRALGLVNRFVINPHYQDKLEIPAEARKRFDELLGTDPGLAPLAILSHCLDHQGESRETRIGEYFAFGNELPVVGLREGAMLHVVDNSVKLKGSTGAIIFRKGKEPTEHKPGESLDFLLE